MTTDEKIEILAEKAFKDDWFNKQHSLGIDGSTIEIEILAEKALTDD